MRNSYQLVSFEAVIITHKNSRDAFSLNDYKKLKSQKIVLHVLLYYILYNLLESVHISAFKLCIETCGNYKNNIVILETFMKNSIYFFIDNCFFLLAH